MLTTDLALWSGIHIVSRQLLGEVLREQFIQNRGMSESASAVKLGQLSGARYLVKGTVYPQGPELFVDIHVLDVESGLVVRTARVKGDLEFVPGLARQLSQEIGAFFGTQISHIVSPDHLSNDEGLSTIVEKNVVSRERSMTVHAEHQSNGSLSQILSVDVPLRLDRLQRLREEALLLADEVWRQGFSIELGDPSFFSRDGQIEFGVNEEVLWLPVSTFFQPEKLRDIHHALLFSILPTDGSSIHGRLILQSEGPSTLRIFTERLRVPRRLFVRAISQDGEIVSVFSAGTWRVDRTLKFRGDGSTSMPVWPEHAIDGDAGFEATILSQHPSVTRFDARVVPVSEEQRLISVEPIEIHAEEMSPSASFFEHQMMLQRKLERWLFVNWEPPVMESLPVLGYLPGNRRVIQLRVNVDKGTIQDVKILQKINERFLMEDVKHLVTRFVGTCLLLCDDESVENLSEEENFVFRIQLDLLKDLQFVGLGEKIP